MRTTITLDADVNELVQRSMRDTGRSFKAVINEALREALGAGSRAEDEVDFPTFSAGPAAFDVDRAWDALDALDSEHVLGLEGRREAG